MMKVAFGWKADGSLIRYFEKKLHRRPEWLIPESHSESDICAVVSSAEILIAGGILSEKILDQAAGLKWVLFPYIGIERHIPVLKNYPGMCIAVSKGNTGPTAQHAVALLLAVTNRITLFHERMKRGIWRRHDDDVVSTFLNGQTAGLLGFGSIGRQIARLMQGFPLNWIACSRSGSAHPDFPGIPVFHVEQLHDFLKKCQILFICLPLTSRTESMIGETELHCLPQGAILINIARGAVVQQKALFDILSRDGLAGAGLDVWYDYQPVERDGKKFPATYPFHEISSVVMSPHRAASPLGRMERFDDVIENLNRFDAGLEPLFRVDLEQGY